MYRASLGLKSLFAGALLAGVLTLPGTAKACGGFFCSQTPVDQTAERIIFSINPKQTISAYVQIAYSGERDAFAWIVPVPSAVELEVFPQLAMSALDLATQPRYFKNGCYLEAPSAGGNLNGSVDSDDGVTVIQEQNVGPYGTVTIEGDSAEQLVNWLKDNDYRITDEMIPFIQKYVDAGSKFLAMRLLPDADVSDIEPIVMTYQGTKPVIPIRLTTVAAQPEMGVVAWILSDKRYAPENYFDLKIKDEDIQFDQWGYNNNYLSLVSREVDKVGGQAFVTEYAGKASVLADLFRNTPVLGGNPDAEEANQKLIELLDSRQYITRLYTRMSAEEMTSDPIFDVATTQSDVSNVHDLSEPNQTCNNTPPPCDFTYCGRSGACVNLEGDTGTAPVSACACTDVATARPTNTNAGQLGVYCEPVAFNFMTDEDVTASVCSNFDCGAHGECVTINANPTCRCEAGYGAVAKQTFNGNTGVATTTMDCVKIAGDIPEPPTLPAIGTTSMPDGSSNGSGQTKSDGGCAVSQNVSSGFGLSSLTWLSLAALVGLSRRRR